MNGSGDIFINFSMTKYFTNYNCIISGGLYTTTSIAAGHLDWCNQGLQVTFRKKMIDATTSLQGLLVTSKENDRHFDRCWSFRKEMID